MSIPSNRPQEVQVSAAANTLPVVRPSGLVEAAVATYARPWVPRAKATERPFVVLTDNSGTRRRP